MERPGAKYSSVDLVACSGSSECVDGFTSPVGYWTLAAFGRQWDGYGQAPCPESGIWSSPIRRRDGLAMESLELVKKVPLGMVRSHEERSRGGGRRKKKDDMQVNILGLTHANCSGDGKIISINAEVTIYDVAFCDRYLD